MKYTKVVGVDIGDYRIKISYIVKGKLKEFFYENIPDNAVKGGMIQYWDAMAEFLRDTFKAHKLRCKSVIFSVPVNGVYVRTVDLPVMTVKQLELNLPFEFHDYISDDTDKYFYDYAVIERGDKNMKLLAVACSKELIERYRTLAKNAKLNAVGLVPDVIGIQRILKRYNQLYSVPEDKDYAILDMGDQSFKIHFYNHGVYDVTRSLEPGGYSFAETISSINGTDVHIARISEEENVDDIQNHEKLLQLYESRAVEIMRALNFYSYSNTANTIDTLYYFGGSGYIRKLVETLSETLNIPVRPLAELNASAEAVMRDIFSLSPHSYGIALDPEEEMKPLTEEEISEISKYHGSFQTILPDEDRSTSGIKAPEDGDKLHIIEEDDEELVRLDDSEAERGNGAREVFSIKENNENKETKAVQESTLKSIEELTEQLNRVNKGDL